ncbi:MAG: aspartate-semialdehyde dehydrogenase [Bacteroidales bacterium]|nr:aspartate-semialdehyde dehydrogenase [Bacteroidales bacterium]
MKLCIVGATGLVGREVFEVLNDYNLTFEKIIPVASARSVGSEIFFNKEPLIVRDIETALVEKPDIAIFSAGSEVSADYAPRFAEQGCFVVDNSSYWRMHENIPLVIPEINAHLINTDTRIISNPNCSTIQMVLTLSRIYQICGIRRIVVSTYQSVTGTGMAAVRQLMGERNQEMVEKAYPYPIDMNCLPHAGKFLPNGYTTEEEKLIHETRKIFQDSSIEVSPTVVRVPVIGGHSESVNVELRSPCSLEMFKQLIAETPGVVLQDDPINNVYPMPLYAKDRNEVFVGRVRQDPFRENTFNLWIVADNLRKGAATNAVQIVKYIIDHILK